MRQSKLNERAATKLDEAADDIQRNGLTRIILGVNSPRSPKCMLGAINYAIFGTTYVYSYGHKIRFRRWAIWNKAINAVAQVLPYQQFVLGSGLKSKITSFSDRASNSSVVVEKLREAANNLRESS